VCARVWCTVINAVSTTLGIDYLLSPKTGFYQAQCLSSHVLTNDLIASGSRVELLPPMPLLPALGTSHMDLRGIAEFG